MGERNRVVSIRGAGSVSGGAYERISIYGSGSVHGDLEAFAVRVWGSGEFESDVQVREMVVRGAGEVTGTLRASRLRSAGALQVKGELQGGDIKTMGALTCGGALQAETFRMRGAFTIGGLLAADHVEIYLGGPCHAEEIGGARIEVHPRTAGGNRSISEAITRLFGTVRTDRRLTATVIEGDEVRLERTTAAVVRGRNVSIGADCRIDRVEYRDHLELHPSAEVTELHRLDAGHGAPIHHQTES